MKKPHRKKGKNSPAQPGKPTGHEPQPATSFNRYSPANLDLLAADLEQGFRDLPVWKKWVQRFGRTAARKFLRRGLVINQLTDGNPGN